MASQGMATAAIFDGPGRSLRHAELALPEVIEPGQVLVRIRLATICGSDLHTFGGQRQEPTPLILGHEGVGEVLAIGSGRKSVAVGDRVTWTIGDSCGRCPACTGYALPQKCRRLFKYGHGHLSDRPSLSQRLSF